MQLNGTPIVISAVAGGVSAPIPTDSRTLVGGKIAVSCVVSAGAALTYEVDYTMDDVFAPGYNPSTGNWKADTNFPNTTAVTTQNTLAIAFATAIRLKVAAAGTGTVSIQAWQSDSTLGA